MKAAGKASPTKKKRSSVTSAPGLARAVKSGEKNGSQVVHAPGGEPDENSAAARRAKAIARGTVLPSVNAAAVIDAYCDNILGKAKVSDSLSGVTFLVDELRETFDESKSGDLHRMEAMLIGQATALQSMFTSLARRAQAQTLQRNLEAFLNLALKAQAQSRATISTLVDLKYPRQATFVKQANIANGPQQVNNGQAGAIGGGASHATPLPSVQNEQLEDRRDGSTYLDSRAAAGAGRRNPQVAALAEINGSRQRGRQGKSGAERLEGGPLEADPGAPKKGEFSAARAKSDD